ncbi:uncharacterized protein LOC114357023 [Ostrinia furnacalis]|uniref:uncharacterized protein LOC114357023 n=1 Tax=Ostrinia furnacalis TaxID=93504 RepID=UPI00103CFF19|nr:uncharacterized protein LOC114357023 [Ostrinia furnacalis]
MDKTYQYIKTSIVTFKLDYCCWIAPVRVGIYIIAYMNILISLVSLVGTANDSYSPTIMKIQEILIEDYVSKPIPILAYATELSFNVLLLCAMYRKDIVLLRVFMNYSIATIISATLVYSMVIAAIDVLLIITVISSVLFQIYVLILVRSAIVEFKEEIAVKNGKIPTEIVFSTLTKEHAEKSEATEVPTAVVTEGDVAPVKEEPKKERDSKLETVDEHPNEVTVEVKP